jgi:hypothetical protein
LLFALIPAAETVIHHRNERDARIACMGHLAPPLHGSPAIDHAVRLEQALAKSQTDRKIVVLHYSPIRATLEGEDPEIFAFLRSSRLEEPINRFRGSAVFHGHATTAFSMGRLRQVFRFTMSQRQLYEKKPENLIE